MNCLRFNEIQILARIMPITTPVVNSYLLIGERIVVVDTLGPRGAKRILREIEKLGKTPEDVSLIVLTHGHTDHIGGAEELRARTRAPIALHWADLERVQEGYASKRLPIGCAARLLSRVLCPQPTPLVTDTAVL